MKRLLSPWWALLTLVALTYMFAVPSNFIQSVKLNYFDTLITGQERVENSVYVAEIDEAALEKYGQYPFPRNIYADIIKDIYDRGAGLVVWNIMMPEPDRFGGDIVLGNTLYDYPVVVATRPSDKSVNEAVNPGAAIINPEYLDSILPYEGIIANIADVEFNAVGSGIVSTEPEIDGVVRRIPTVAVVDGVLYPSLALETLRVIAGDPSFQIKLQPNGVEKMRIPQFGIIPTDNEGRVWIDWSQKSKSVSVANLPDNFDGSVVIVDVTAAGIANPVPTALGSMFSGQTQAAVLATMFTGTNIKRPDWAAQIELLALFCGGLLIILLSRWMVLGLITTTALSLALVPYSVYVYSTQKILLDASALLVTFIIIALQVYGIKFVREFLEKQAIKKQFGGYASPEVVEMLQKNPELIKQGQKKEVSIVFTDLRGFTPLGESFGDDVKGLTDVMNGYMDAISKPVLDANGMIIKYIGDASMHIHNAPVDDANHPRTAVQTGLNMLKAVEKFNEKLMEQGKPEVGMGAGINSGLGYIGEMGSTARHSYDLLGDSVSTAARLESACKGYGVVLIVGPHTHAQTEKDFFYLKLDCLAVKGKTVGLDIYTVLDDTKPSWNASRKHHDQMHNLYGMKDFEGAIKQARLIRRSFDGKMANYYDFWIERCEYMKTQDLPEVWDGIFRATTK